MELKPGYKQTEVGVIPEDWDVRSLQDLCKEEITYGIVQCGPHIPGGIPYIRVSDMDGPILEREKMLCTSSQIASRFRRSEVRHGDIVYALRGRLGDVRSVPLDLDGGNLTQGTARLSPSFRVHSSFLLWALRNPEVVLRACAESKGTTFMEISLADLRQIKIALPPEPEQIRIASTLSDIEYHLTTLDRELAKKRNIKQAAMQELLTGKRRLPGFEGEWEVKRLGDVAPLQRGFDLPNPKLEDGPYPVVYSNGVMNHHAAFQVKGPGVVTGRSGTIGKVHYVANDFWPHNTSLWVTNFRGNDPKFIFYLLSGMGIERFASGSGVPTLNRNDLHDQSIRIPSETREQVAIAAVLTDLDTDLDASNQQLAKAKLLKQGMMQQLLTGKIRLQ